MPLLRPRRRGNATLLRKEHPPAHTHPLIRQFSVDTIHPTQDITTSELGESETWLSLI